MLITLSDFMRVLAGWQSEGAALEVAASDALAPAAKSFGLMLHCLTAEVDEEGWLTLAWETGAVNFNLSTPGIELWYYEAEGGRLAQLRVAWPSGATCVVSRMIKPS